MTIATIELTQRQSYQQTSNQRQKVTLLTPALTPNKMTFNENSKDQFSPSLSDRLNHSNVTEIPPTQDEVTYERPKEIKLQLMILVLERFLGHQLDFSDFSFAESKVFANSEISNVNLASINEVPSTTDTEQVDINGQSFQRNDLLSVEQWHSRKQHLNYEIQGVFNVNEQELSLSYNFTLSSEQESYSKVEMSAAALKDPIIVQFGSQGLGNIKGQIEFAINQDNTLDSLPIFSGDVGYLVYDKNNNQQADDGSELFGPQTGQGFAELAQLDSNNNGFIDTEDQQFEQLYLWQPSDDKNITGQWLSLKEAKIQAISLSAINTPFDFYDQQGQIQAQLRQSSFAISEDGLGRGVHQVDVRI